MHVNNFFIKNYHLRLGWKLNLGIINHFPINLGLYFVHLQLLYHIMPKSTIICCGRTKLSIIHRMKNLSYQTKPATIFSCRIILSLGFAQGLAEKYIFQISVTLYFQAGAPPPGKMKLMKAN